MQVFIITSKNYHAIVEKYQAGLSLVMAHPLAILVTRLVPHEIVQVGRH